MRRGVSVAAAAAFVLGVAGCAPSVPGGDVPVVTSSVEAAPVSSVSSAEPVEWQFNALGEPFDAACFLGECSARLTVDRIERGGACEYIDLYQPMPGVEAPTAPPLPRGTHLVQFWGTLEGGTPMDGMEDVGSSLGQPEAWDADRYKNMAQPRIECAPPEGFQDWMAFAKEGESVPVYGAFAIADGSEVLGLGKGRLDLKPFPVAPPGSGARTIEIPEILPQEGPALGYDGPYKSTELIYLDKEIERCATLYEEMDGTTYFTDGSKGWTDNCFWPAQAAKRELTEQYG